MPSTELVVRVRTLTVVLIFAFAFVVLGVFFWSRTDTLQLWRRATRTRLQLILSFHCLTVNRVQVWELTILVANSLEQLRFKRAEIL